MPWDDYIVKPFDAEALRAKIKVITYYKAQHTELILQIEDARKTAFIAIAGTSDLGQAIQFIENTHTVFTHEQLAHTFFRITNNMGLSCSILISANRGDLFFSSTRNAVSPLEINLMTTLKKGGRFFDFGCRTQINYPKISILIKNMPMGDAERYGRIKDVLPAMLSTADTKVTQINTMLAITEQLKEADECFAMITKTLEDINHLSQQQQKDGIKVMRTMLMELDKKLPSMALEEDQELYILDRIDSVIEEAHATISKAINTNASFVNVIGNLRALNTKLKVIHDQIVPVDEPLSNAGALVNGEMDVELF